MGAKTTRFGGDEWKYVKSYKKQFLSSDLVLIFRNDCTNYITFRIEKPENGEFLDQAPASGEG